MSNTLQNSRLLRDAALVVTKALPAAGASNNSGTIDLNLGPWHPEEIFIEISLPALSAHTDSSKDVTIKLQHSADDSSYEDLDDGVGSLPDITLTTPGVTTTGTAARIARIKLPAGTKRYVQFNQAVTSGGPTVTAVSVTYSVLV